MPRSAWWPRLKQSRRCAFVITPSPKDTRMISCWTSWAACSAVAPAACTSRSCFSRQLPTTPPPARTVASMKVSSRLSGVAKPGKTPEEVEQALYKEIERMQKELVDANELQKVKNQYAANNFRGIQSNFGLMVQLLLRDNDSRLGDHQHRPGASSGRHSGRCPPRREQLLQTGKSHHRDLLHEEEGRQPEQRRKIPHSPV